MLTATSSDVSMRRQAMDPLPFIRGTARRWEFRPEEVQRLQWLRRHFLAEPDVFTDRELSRLTFVRWLVNTGRLETG